jgi:hypothetical protein
MPKKTYLLGIDIETGGPILDSHPLLAVGFCMYVWNGRCNDQSTLTLVDTCEVHMEAHIDSYEPDTLEFWIKNKEAWEAVRSDTVSKKEAAEILIRFLRKWQLEALTTNMSFKIITDNCWFDDTWTSWFLCTHGNHVGGRPLRHNYYSGFTRVDHMIDVNQRIQAVTSDMGSMVKLLPFQASVPHDHTPVSDARGIVEKYVNYMHSLAMYRLRGTKADDK